MGKYQTNLIETIEKMNNTFKWFVIAVAVIIGIAILIYGIRSASTVKPAREEIVVVQGDTIADDSNVRLTTGDSKQEEESIEPEPDVEMKKKNPLDDVKYLNAYNGYEITGVIIERGKQPVVYLRKNGETDTYRIGDSVGNATVESIHRNHIVLKHGSTIYHLNNIN